MSKSAEQILDELLLTEPAFIEKCISLTLFALENTQVPNTYSWSVVPQTQQPSADYQRGLIKNCYLNIEMISKNNSERATLSAYLSEHIEISFLKNLQKNVQSSMASLNI